MLIQSLNPLKSFLDYYLSAERIRFLTREVRLGDLPMGGNNPLRVQSMTNTDTNDTESTVRQCVQLAEAGCEIVRITAQGVSEAKNLLEISKTLRAKGCKIPLIADIHFQPKAAEIAAGIVEKVRINPGNYYDRNNFLLAEYTEKQYNLELEHVADKLSPLVSICKRNGTVLRIGSNHGSLSKRIIARYGDTPAGMVESALEFARICRGEGFHDLVLSMKSSNVRVMVQSTRLLVQKMLEEKMDYPIHLGVTEAGDGEDGIIKSASGIGALLIDGIGDTIRVSLTGDPVKEIPVAKEIVKRFTSGEKRSDLGGKWSGESGTLTDEGLNSLRFGQMLDPFSYKRRTGMTAGCFGGNNPVQVLVSHENELNLVDETGTVGETISKENLVHIHILRGSPREMRLEAIKLLMTRSAKPIILKNAYLTKDTLEFQVNAAIDAGSLLIDSIGDGLSLEAPELNKEWESRTAFGILQATRTRITRMEFISCPSCGRTQFDIESALKKVKQATSHLKGLKIAVMGCIVNGPGEMADADYGYVGAGRGRITLYKGREVMKRNLPEMEAIEALIGLIRSSGDWCDEITDLTG